MSNKINIIGDTYGNLEVLEEVAITGKYTRNYLCKCICGNTSVVVQGHLRNGHTTSCGCKVINMRNSGEIRRTHGQSKTKLYKVWVQMNQRCFNPKDTKYPQYGAKGIKVCSYWQEFEPFLTWAIANGYKEGLSIDREDGRLGYAPTNCRWTTSVNQAINTKLAITNTTGYRGISSRKSRYIVRITNGGNRVQVGSFASIEEALIARDSYYTTHSMIEHIKAIQYE